MPITDKQREWRRNHLGSSDSPALFGLHPFKNAGDLYLEKTEAGLAPERESEIAEIGKLTEPWLIDGCAERLGVTVIKNQQRVCKPHPIFAASFDALIRERVYEAIEAKTAGIGWPLAVQELWGEDGTDEVSDYVVIQTHHQMLVGNLKRVWVPVLIAGRSPCRCLFHVERNETIIGEIIERGVAFWERVVRRESPSGIVPSMNYLRRVHRQPNKIVSLDRPLVEQWQAAEMTLKSAKATAEKMKAAVLSAMGDAEGGQIYDGGGVTYLEQFTKGYEVKAHTKRKMLYRKPEAWRKYRAKQLPAPADSGDSRGDTNRLGSPESVGD